MTSKTKSTDKPANKPADKKVETTSSIRISIDAKKALTILAERMGLSERLSVETMINEWSKQVMAEPKTNAEKLPLAWAAIKAHNFACKKKREYDMYIVPNAYFFGKNLGVNRDREAKPFMQSIAYDFNMHFTALFQGAKKDQAQNVDEYTMHPEVNPRGRAEKSPKFQQIFGAYIGK